MKTFLGLPVVQSTNLWGLFRHILSIILFSGLGYFGTAILTGAYSGDIWMYIQSTQKFYVTQGILLLVGIFIGHLTRVFLNTKGDRFFHFPKVDKWFYPLAIVITYLVLNEIWGF